MLLSTLPVILSLASFIAASTIPGHGRHTDLKNGHHNRQSPHHCKPKASSSGSVDIATSSSVVATSSVDTTSVAIATSSSEVVQASSSVAAIASSTQVFVVSSVVTSSPVSSGFVTSSIASVTSSSKAVVTSSSNAVVTSSSKAVATSSSKAVVTSSSKAVVTSSSATATASSEPTGVASTGSNPKRGLAFAASSNLGDIVKIDQTNTAISWVYDWGMTPSAQLASSKIPYVPMAWGNSPTLSSFESIVEGEGATVVLGFNEPDMSSQSNLSPSDAATLWMQYIQPLKTQHNVILGAPAVSSSPGGLPWLASFLDACKDLGCTIDFIPLHWYGDGVQNFYNYISSAHGEFPGYPIWVTEFASTNSDPTEVASFMTASIAYLDTLDWIERYAWFGYFRDDDTSEYSLLDSNGNLNELGTIYAAYPSN